LRLCALAVEARPHRADLVAALPQDVDEVGGHAAREREGQRLHGRRSRGAVAVEGERLRTGRALETQVAFPDELELDRGLGHVRKLARPRGRANGPGRTMEPWRGRGS